MGSIESAKAGKRRRAYLEYHATAILGLQMLLPGVSVTSSSTHDTKVPASVQT